MFLLCFCFGFSFLFLILCTIFPGLFVFLLQTHKFNSQVLSTLHEYPCLEACIPLIHYISDCVRLAWKMTNQTVPYYLDTDFTLGQLLLLISLFEVFVSTLIFIPGLLQPDKHERYPISEKRSDIIRAFLWPALMQNGRCIQKAVVAT